MKKAMKTAVAAAGLAFLLTGCSGGSKVERLLREEAATINASCPAQMDAITRLDSVTVSLPDTLRFHYTLEADSSRYDYASIRANLPRRLIENVRINPRMVALREQDAVFVHDYCFPDGGLYFEFAVTPELYNHGE